MDISTLNEHLLIAIKQNNQKYMKCCLLACLIMDEKNNLKEEEKQQNIKQRFYICYELVIQYGKMSFLLMVIDSLIEKSKCIIDKTFHEDMFQKAIQCCNWSVIKYLLDKKNIQVSIEHINLLISNKHIIPLIYLLNHKNNNISNVDLKNAQIMIHACQNDISHLVKWLINKGISINIKCIQACIAYGSVDCLNLLLGKGCYMNRHMLLFTKHLVKKEKDGVKAERMNKCCSIIEEHLKTDLKI